ncbi:MAG: hypothetical protein A3I66_01405 [Burkholderiales bacterium RIFCSPLOWO2_02_FULL_57_36]|nr:MAG: hypothetical protein A3I66_01405 [Burkholderiales bacterium RIFCSPLOWO2_02_FULL_57_36]
MALTAAQKTDVRRFAGYPMEGTVAGSAVVIYNRTYPNVTLSDRLDQLTSSEELILINTYLTNLTALETAIVGVSTNLDTDEAAVWKHNKNERQDREGLFNSWRRKMCAFLGFPPGPGLGSGDHRVSLVRT